MKHTIFAVILAVLPSAALAQGVETPPTFQFGADITTHQSTFETQCSNANHRVLDPSENPMAQVSLEQVDCEGFEYFGAPRLAEFVFADGQLTHVWILVNESDLPSLEAEFETIFGAPSHVAAEFTAFTQSNSVVRKDIPEALYYGLAAAPLFDAWFTQMAGQ